MTTPAPLTPEEVRRAHKQAMKRRGIECYTEWEYNHVGTIEYPECIDGCGAHVKSRNQRCAACSHDHLNAREAARRERQRAENRAGGKTPGHRNKGRRAA